METPKTNLLLHILLRLGANPSSGCSSAARSSRFLWHFDSTSAALTKNEESVMSWTCSGGGKDALAMNACRVTAVMRDLYQFTTITSRVHCLKCRITALVCYYDHVEGVQVDQDRFLPDSNVGRASSSRIYHFAASTNWPEG